MLSLWSDQHVLAHAHFLKHRLRVSTWAGKQPKIESWPVWPWTRKLDWLKPLPQLGDLSFVNYCWPSLTTAPSYFGIGIQAYEWPSSPARANDKPLASTLKPINKFDWVISRLNPRQFQSSEVGNRGLKWIKDQSKDGIRAANYASDSRELDTRGWVQGRSKADRLTWDAKSSRNDSWCTLEDGATGQTQRWSYEI